MASVWTFSLGFLFIMAGLRKRLSNVASQGSRINVSANWVEAVFEIER